MNTAPQRCRRRSRAEKQQVIKEWLASGLSAQDFADQAEVGISSLWRWKNEVAQGGSGAALVPVMVRAELDVDVPQGPTRCAPIELMGRSGRVIRVFAGCEPSLLRAVLAVSEEGAPC